MPQYDLRSFSDSSVDEPTESHLKFSPLSIKQHRWARFAFVPRISVNERGFLVAEFRVLAWIVLRGG